MKALFTTVCECITAVCIAKLIMEVYNTMFRCIDEGEDFRCICEGGYKGVLCELDIDECANHPCYNGGACLDKVAHYECRCPEYASGLNCENLDTNSSKPSLQTSLRVCEMYMLYTAHNHLYACAVYTSQT